MQSSSNGYKANIHMLDELDCLPNYVERELAFEVAKNHFINTCNGWALHQLHCYYQGLDAKTIASFLNQELIKEMKTFAGIGCKNRKLLLV